MTPSKTALLLNLNQKRIRGLYKRLIRNNSNFYFGAFLADSELKVSTLEEAHVGRWFDDTRRRCKLLAHFSVGFAVLVHHYMYWMLNVLLKG